MSGKHGCLWREIQSWKIVDPIDCWWPPNHISRTKKRSNEDDDGDGCDSHETESATWGPQLRRHAIAVKGFRLENSLDLLRAFLCLGGKLTVNKDRSFDISTRVAHHATTSFHETQQQAFCGQTHLLPSVGNPSQDGDSMFSTEGFIGSTRKI